MGLPSRFGRFDKAEVVPGVEGPEGGAIRCEAEFCASFLVFHLRRAVSSRTTDVDVIARIAHFFLYEAAFYLFLRFLWLTSVFSLLCFSPLFPIAGRFSCGWNFIRVPDMIEIF